MRYGDYGIWYFFYKKSIIMLFFATRFASHSLSNLFLTVVNFNIFLHLDSNILIYII